MRIFASPRRGHCASCEYVLGAAAVYRMDETYCCVGCAHGGPCVCSYEADLADDGVNGVGTPFATGDREPLERRVAAYADADAVRSRH